MLPANDHRFSGISIGNSPPIEIVISRKNPRIISAYSEQTGEKIKIIWGCFILSKELFDGEMEDIYQSENRVAEFRRRFTLEEEREGDKLINLRISLPDFIDQQAVHIKNLKKLDLEDNRIQLQRYNHPADRAEYQQLFLEVVLRTRVDKSSEAIDLAARAITLLKKLRFTFTGMDLSGISIPKADLSGAILNGTKLNNANLKGVRFLHANLIDADMTGADLTDADFGLMPYLFHDYPVKGFILSHQDEHVAVLTAQLIYIWNLKEAKLLKIIKLDCLYMETAELIFSKNNEYLLFYSSSIDGLKVWNVEKGQLELSRSFYYEKVHFSPDGQFILNWDARGFTLYHIDLGASSCSLKKMILDMKAQDFNLKLCCFSLDSKLIAFMSIPAREWDKKVRFHIYPIPSTEKKEGTAEIYWEEDTTLVLSSLQFFNDNDNYQLLGIGKEEVWKWNIKSQQEGHNSLTSFYKGESPIGHLKSFASTSSRKIAYTFVAYTFPNQKLICLKDTGNQQFDVCQFELSNPSIPIIISHQQDMILSTCQTNQLAIWKIGQITQQEIFPEKVIEDFYFSPDDRFITFITKIGLNKETVCSFNSYEACTGKSHNKCNLTLEMMGNVEAKDNNENYNEDPSTLIPIQYEYEFADTNTKETRFYLWNLEKKKLQSFFSWNDVKPTYLFALDKQNCFSVFLLQQKDTNQWRIELWHIPTRKKLLLIANFPSHLLANASFESLALSLNVQNEEEKIYLAVATQDTIFFIKFEKEEDEYNHIYLGHLERKIQKIQFIQKSLTEIGLLVLAKNQNYIEYIDLHSNQLQTVRRFTYQNVILSFDFFVKTSSSLVVMDEEQSLFLTPIERLHQNEREPIHTQPTTKIYDKITQLKCSVNGERLVAYQKATGILYSWRIFDNKLYLDWYTPRRLFCQGLKFQKVEAIDPANKKLLRQLTDTDSTDDEMNISDIFSNGNGTHAHISSPISPSTSQIFPHPENSRSLSKKWRDSIRFPLGVLLPTSTAPPLVYRAMLNENQRDCAFNAVFQLILHTPLLNYLKISRFINKIDTKWFDFLHNLTKRYFDSDNQLTAFHYDSQQARMSLGFFYRDHLEDAAEVIYNIFKCYGDHFYSEFRRHRRIDINEATPIDKNPEEYSSYNSDNHHQTDYEYILKLAPPSSPQYLQHSSVSFQQLVDNYFQEHPVSLDCIFTKKNQCYRTHKVYDKVDPIKLKRNIFIQIEKFEQTDDKVLLKSKSVISFNDFNLTISNKTYNLKGFIVRYGEKVGNGHFITYIQTSRGEWVCFNDEKTPIILKKDDIIKEKLKEAYILYFHR